MIRVLFLALCSYLAGTEPPPAPKLLRLDNKSTEIGIDRTRGASITHLSWNSYPDNVVNIHDPGRLIQQSYYAGKRLDRKEEGQSMGASPWSWNPIQGGGVGSWARVKQFEKTNSNLLFSETVPKLWDMPDEEADALMRQWTSFEPDMPNVIQVRCEFIAMRATNDRWGPTKENPQEIPATYFTRNFDTFKSYLGDGKWSTEPTKLGPPWNRSKSKRIAIACFEQSGQGIAIFSPDADSWNYGPHGAEGTRDPLGGPCVHLAPIARVLLGPKSTLNYRYWLIVGNEAELTASLDILWKKYADERIRITNP